MAFGVELQTLQDFNEPALCLQQAFKISRGLMLVRHPFSRLVSAYRDKLDVEAPDHFREEAEKIVGKTRAKSANNTRRDNPTFTEFIEYLTTQSPDQYNEHWMPTYVKCRPCSVNYEFIMKLETIQEDVEYVMKAVGANVTGFERLNQRTSDSMETTRKYFERLPEEKIEQLYENYKFDFELFGYRRLNSLKI
ncbi:unnamed protein product [Cyprideis torosa]|uniref:Carbohydrate sulfotransferase n=1 Tax=Cyprideis torosa TaxID=163714 RepID=A0A7R8ZTW2_9CRUS|nr:unnamed protein product [Cyprideis torosa]CAG0898933.1 unnamed protein product [Cyprideis torosa]